jgi:hypothetical protein
MSNELLNAHRPMAGAASSRARDAGSNATEVAEVVGNIGVIVGSTGGLRLVVIEFPRPRIALAGNGHSRNAH